MTFTTILTVHKISVELFFLLYLVKTAMLLMGKASFLDRVTKVTKIPEMILSTLFLVTGIYLMTQVPNISGFLITKIVLLLACIPLAIVAFKKKNKILALFALFLLTMVYLFAEMNRMNTGEMDKSTVDGQAIYTQMCVSCHGTDGKLKAKDATDLSTSVLESRDAMNIIRNGGIAMPGFKNGLTEEQILAVTEHIQSLKTMAH